MFSITLPEVLRTQLRMARSGRIIPVHRGLRRLGRGGELWLQVIALPLLMIGVYLLMLPWITHAWSALVASLINSQSLSGSLSNISLLPSFQLASEEHSLMGSFLSLPIIDNLLSLSLPRLETVSYLPDTFSLFITIAIVFLAAIGVSLLPDRLTPLKYFVRFLCLTQAIATIFFFFSHEAYSYPLSYYFSDMLRSSIFIVLFTPLVLTAIYFIFDVGVWRKLGVGFGIMVYLLVLSPFLYAAHAWLLQHSSMLFHPLLFIVFGPLIQVLIFIALYGWAMSWRPLDAQRTFTAPKAPPPARPV